MYYTIEDGHENCIEMTHNKKRAIHFCKKTKKAKEVFYFNDNDELIGCIYSKKTRR